MKIANPNFVLRGKVYLLQSCSTCKRILKEVSNFGKFEVIDVKINALSIEDVDRLADKAGGYEAIFNKQSLKYRALGLKDKSLTESDYRKFLTEEYTFLKRPVFIVDNNIYVGNSKSTIKMLTDYLHLTAN